MATLFVRHTLTDFGKWKKVYDDFGPTRTKMGVTGDAVYRGTDNPNDVTITHDFASLAAGQAFVASDELRVAMQNGGVVGAPTVWFVNKA